MVAIAQSAANWRNTHTHTLTCIAHIHSHTYINTVTTTWCQAPAQLWHSLESNFYFEDTWGRGCKPVQPEKTLDSLPADRYHIIIRGENITFRTGIEPSPSNIGGKLTWPSGRAEYGPSWSCLQSHGIHFVSLLQQDQEGPYSARPHHVVVTVLM